MKGGKGILEPGKFDSDGNCRNQDKVRWAREKQTLTKGRLAIFMEPSPKFFTYTMVL